MKPSFSGAAKALLLFMTLGLSCVSFPALANLSITPTIVVIEGRQRYADVYLVNPTETTNSYEVYWRFLKMQPETGTYQNSDTSVTTWDLSKHLVFTPKRVTIEPQGAQKVRLGLRLGGEPPAPGDYRAHLEFMKMPDPAPSPVVTGERKDKAKASVGVKVNVGFSIPVIYRVGESDATAKIGDIKTRLNDKKIEAVIPITKSKSAYGVEGNLTVTYKGEIVGQVKNANIFAEIDNRTFIVPLKVNELSGGSITVTYVDGSKDKKTYDEKTINVGQ